MPAAAVIPAPIAYTKVVAVKKLVVGFLLREGRPCACVTGQSVLSILPKAPASLTGGRLGEGLVYFEKNRVFKAGKCLE